MKIKQIDREKLFFSKYTYRIVFETHCLYYLYWEHTIDSFKDRVIETSKNDINSYSWSRRVVTPSKVDYQLVEKLIALKKKYKNKDVIFRHEGDKMSLFANDLKIIQEAWNIDPNLFVTQIALSPAGIKYFKKEPPAKYRMYLKSRQVEDPNDLAEFVKRTPDMKPNSCMIRGMEGMKKYRYRYIHSDYYFDFNEDTTTTLFGLMFPELVGKVYKLEKKTD